MQFAEVLTKEEAKTVGRFAESFEAEYALSEDFPVISLAKTIECGGFTARKKSEKPKRSDPEAGAIIAPAPVLMDGHLRFEAMRAYLNRSVPEPTFNFEPRPALTQCNIPKLALAPASAKEVRLDSGDDGYCFSADDWRSQTFKPTWHTLLPSRGRAGWDLHQSHFTAALPPLPREARQAINDYSSALVLYEADWEEREQYLDPAIIVPVWRDLFSVVYSWDLTDAERDALRKASGLRNDLHIHR